MSDDAILTASKTVGFPQRVFTALSVKRISAVYVGLVLIGIFALWVPSTFLTIPVWKSLLASGAITALLTIGLVLPLAAGAFDLAIGSEIGFGAVFCAWLLSAHHLPFGLVLVLTMLVGAGIGVVSGLLITKGRIDSFITTLGMSSILLALIAWVSSGGQEILNVGTSVASIANDEIFGIVDPFWIMLLVGVIVWYGLQRTPAGRRVYATGGNPTAARLAGVRTGLIIVGSLAACGAIAGLSGSLVTAQLDAGDPTIGPGYLLPAFAAAFLGSTQFRGGRYNVWGSIIAVYVLDIGVKGLQLGGAPVWLPDLFNGAALLLAVGLARFQHTSGRSGAIHRTFGRFFSDQRAPDSETRPVSVPGQLDTGTRADSRTHSPQADSPSGGDASRPNVSTATLNPRDPAGVGRDQAWT
jgi:ribose transport system permease protein